MLFGAVLSPPYFLFLCTSSSPLPPYMYQQHWRECYKIKTKACRNTGNSCSSDTQMSLLHLSLCVSAHVFPFKFLCTFLVCLLVFEVFDVNLLAQLSFLFWDHLALVYNLSHPSVSNECVKILCSKHETLSTLRPHLPSGNVYTHLLHCDSAQ